MKRIILLFTLCLFASSGFGQINLNKIKKKVKIEKKSDKGTKEDKEIQPSNESNAPSSSSESSTPISKSDEDKRTEAYRSSPARSAIWDFNDIMKGVEEKPAGIYATDELAKAEKKLQIIKDKDPGYAYTSELEVRMAKSKELVETSQAKQNVQKEYDQKLEKWYRDLLNLKDEPWKYDEVLKGMSNEKFNALVQEIEGSEASNSTLKSKIEKVKNYKIEVMTGKVKEAIIKDNEEAYRKAVMWTAEYRKNPDFEKYLGFSQKVDPEVEGLNNQMKWTKELQSEGVEGVELTEFITKAESRLKEIEAYRDSGELEKLQKKMKHNALDEIRLGKNPRSDGSVTALVNKDFDTEKFGKPIRIVTSGDWYLIKNSLDIPVRKEKVVYLVYKDNEGQCIRYETEVHRDYEGGSTYGKMYLDDSYAVTEMLCENVNK